MAQEPTRLGLPRREAAWLATAAAAVVVLGGGAIALPRLVWDRFLWQYFWGPVFADANNAACAVRVPGGAPELLGSDAACASAAAGRIVAYPGYTVISEIGYAVTLIFMLLGVLFLLQHLEVGHERGFFFALTPFVFLGGALRVVEDANDAAAPTPLGQVIDWPLNALIISPVIYFTMFVFTLAALVVAVKLADRGVIDRYEPALLWAGIVATALTIAYLAVAVTDLAAVTTSAGFYPQVTVLTLLFSGVLAYGLYRAFDRWAPGLNAGTRRIGLVVLFGHALDGVANVLASDWAGLLGLPFAYSPKHPINRFIIDITQAVAPAGLVEAIGSAWPFLLVKLVAASIVLALFDRSVFDESPRYAVLLLVAILAVGLGPGTRDMIRATFGI
jgi:uncharacterized membrane protein